jgi:hypothetical protein
MKKPLRRAPQNPMADEGLENNFLGLAATVLPHEPTARIASTVRNLAEMNELRDLADFLVSPAT